MTLDSSLAGSNFIAGRESALGTERFQALNATTGETLPTSFAVATAEEIHRAVEAAATVSVSVPDRIALLNAIADEIEVLGDELLNQANLETGLPLARLTGERGRTVGQLRLFAKSLGEGLGQEVITDEALPDRVPAPRPLITRILIPVGPVAVFGASNFPFAFSVAGGDTASALAAGCPVIVKAHPLHPGTSELTARAIYRAIEKTGVNPAIFSLVHGQASVGSALVDEPELRAVAFTGSLRAGRALFDQANRRPVPIPVFAEMGSVNPIFLLPGALAERGTAIAQGYTESLTVGMGQFCTNPGLVIGISSPEWESFVAAVAEKVDGAAVAPMLAAGIADNYERVAHEFSEKLPTATMRTGHTVPRLFRASAKQLLADAALREECFGPAGIAVECESEAEMVALAKALDGQLTGTLHTSEADRDLADQLIPILARRVGRLVFNGFPTGVEVSYATQHGGPYPATTDARFTSVGTQAIYRFLRPLAVQNPGENWDPASI